MWGQTLPSGGMSEQECRSLHISASVPVEIEAPFLPVYVWAERCALAGDGTMLSPADQSHRGVAFVASFHGGQDQMCEHRDVSVTVSLVLRWPLILGGRTIRGSIDSTQRHHRACPSEQNLSLGSKLTFPTRTSD